MERPLADKIIRTWLLFFFSTILFLSFPALVCTCEVPERLQRRMETVWPGDQNEIGVAVNGDSEMKEALGTILNEFRGIDAIRPQLGCLTGMNDTLMRVGEIVQNLGFPMFDSCMARIDYKHRREEKVKVRRLSRALDKFESGLAEKGANALRNINPSIIDDRKGFGLPVAVGNIPWEQENNYYRCSIHHGNAYRLREKWYYVAELTNVPSTEKVGARQRYFYREMFGLNQDNQILVQPVIVPRCRDGRARNVSGNAWVEVWGGTTNASVYMEGDIDTNPALMSVLNSISGKEEDVVMDSDIASNLAILILPTFLALVPLSLFQDVGTGVTVVYILLTDVISVLPVGIKGIELLELASHEHYSRAGYVYGSGASPILGVELWVSSCRLRPFVRNRGIGLLVGAGVATILGIVLEFAVKAKVEKYKSLNNAHLSKELELDAERHSLERHSLERHSLDSPESARRRSSLYSEQVVNYIQRGGTGGLLWHLEQRREFSQ